MEQGTFDDIEMQEKTARAKAIGQELERRLKAVAHGIERKRFAALIDKSYSYASEMLNTNSEQSQKPFQTIFAGALLVEAPDLFAEEVLAFCEDLCGREHPQKKRELTPEERLQKIADGLRKMDLQGHENFKDLL